MHVSILVPKGPCVLSSVVGPFKIFNKVNEYLINTGQRAEPFFDIHLVGLESENELYDGAFAIRISDKLEKISKTDLVVIPAILGDITKSLEANSAFIPWILKQRREGAEVASLCMGAFLLAATGLVDGKRCTTHWLGIDAFQQMYPAVNLVAENIIVDEDGIYSSGGAYSFLNLILYLVEKYCGRETAIFCSKLFEIELDRYSQSQFAIFQSQRDHQDEAIKNAQEYIESNYTQKISIEKLAEMFALSQRNFIRRFKKATSNTPSEYIQRVKIEAAKKELESSTHNVNEIMYAVGYSDSKAFRTVFKKYTGVSPMNYKNKYNRQLAY